MADRVAVVVDADNVLASAVPSADVSPEQLLQRLTEHFAPIEHAIFASRHLGTESAFQSAAHNLLYTTNLVPRNVDVAIAVWGMQVLERVDQLVVVSGDPDFVPLLQAVMRTGKKATIVSPIDRMSGALALPGVERLTPQDLSPAVIVDGLVIPGDGADKLEEIARLFKRARRRVVVLDPWTSEVTIRLMAFSESVVELVLVTGRLHPSTKIEAEAVLSAGRKLGVYQSLELHDRFFASDERWWQSGGSLKDLGKKVSRIAEIQKQSDRADLELLLGQLTGSSHQLL